MSIYDRAYRNVMDSKNIMTHYHLTTQLKGKIYDPAYYFDENNGNAIRAMDLLLMTQGWRKYFWNEANLKSGNPNKKAFAHDRINGTLINGRNTGNGAIPQPAIMAYNPLKENNIDLIVPNEEGKFSVGPEHLKMGKEGICTYD